MGEDYVPFRIRQREADRAGQPVIYLYDELPANFMIQVHRIIVDTIGTRTNSRTHYVDRGSRPLKPETVYDFMWSRVCDELAIVDEGETPRGGVYELCHGKAEKYSVPDLLTFVEIAFRILDLLPESYSYDYGCFLTGEQAVKKLNRRFREYDLGYAFEVDRIVRVDSQFIHAQVVDPALRLLVDASFGGAQAQFLNAHTHFKQGRNDDAIMNAGRAFESTLKHICDEMEWEHSPTPQAKELIRVVSENGLFPSWHQTQLGALGTLLTALPTARNKEAGHARTTVQEAPDDVAKLALHLCATNIVFAVEAYNRLKAEQDG